METTRRAHWRAAGFRRPAPCFVAVSGRREARPYCLLSEHEYSICRLVSTSNQRHSATLECEKKPTEEKNNRISAEHRGPKHKKNPQLRVTKTRYARTTWPRGNAVDGPRTMFQGIHCRSYTRFLPHKYVLQCTCCNCVSVVFPRSEPKSPSGQRSLPT